MIKNDGKIPVESMRKYAAMLADGTAPDADSFPFNIDEFRRGIDMFKLSGDDVSDDAEFSLNDDFIDLNRNTEYEFEDESLYEDADEHYSLNTSSIFPDFMKDELETTEYWQDDCFIKNYKDQPYNIAEHFNSTLGVNVEAAEPTIFTFKIVGSHYIAITGLKPNIDIKGDYGGVLTIPNKIRFDDDQVGYVRYISVEAFMDNPGIEHVVLSENVKVIEDYAFSCPNLKSISGLSGVLSIAPTAFMGTQLLDTDSFNRYNDEHEILSVFDIEYEVKGPYIFITKYVGKKTKIFIPARLSDKLVVGIGDQAFKGTKVYTVKLPDSIKFIGSKAFAFSDLRDISMPDGLLAIGDEAFAGTLLDKAYLPSTLVHIGRAVFACCRCLSSVRLPDSLTQISTALFATCTALSTIILPKYCISIGNGAFYECRNLKFIPMPSYLENIGKSAFKGCHMLSYIELPPSLSHLGTAAFANCDNLETVHINANIDEIPQACFHSCTALSDVKFFNNIQHIGLEAFKVCVSLRNLRLPSSLKTIQAAAFYGCRSLVDLNLPRNLRFIGELAFAQCGLHRIMSEGIFTKFEKNCFKNDSELRSVIFRGPIWGFPEAIFEGCVALTTVIMPCDEMWYSNVPSNVDIIAPFTVDNFAFKDCKSLKYITFPKLFTISEKAFEGTDLRMQPDNSFGLLA